MIHIQLYTYTCGNIINNNDERTHFFRRTYLSHFIRNGCERVAKGLCVRGELETEPTSTYWPPVPLFLAALLSRCAGLLNQESWGPIALCWVLALSTAAYLQLTEPVCGTGLYNCLTSTCFLWASHLYCSHVHDYGHGRNGHIMFITIKHIKNIRISKFENTKRLLVQVRNLFINFESKVST